MQIRNISTHTLVNAIIANNGEIPAHLRGDHVLIDRIDRDRTGEICFYQIHVFNTQWDRLVVNVARKGDEWQAVNSTYYARRKARCSPNAFTGKTAYGARMARMAHKRQNG